MFGEHPAAIQFGVPRGKPSMAALEAMYLFAAFILLEPGGGNTVKALEARLFLYPLCFQTVIQLPAGQVFVFFGLAARPIDDHALNSVLRPHSEGDRKFGLGKIA